MTFPSRRRARELSDAVAAARAGRRAAERRRFGRAACLHVAALLAALLGQMLLPVAHAAERVRGAADAALAQAADRDALPTFTPASRDAARHDPARCAVCRSLVHTSPALSGPAELLPRVAPRQPFALAASGPCADAPDRTHPPRAPPVGAARHAGA